MTPVAFSGEFYYSRLMEERNKTGRDIDLSFFLTEPYCAEVTIICHFRSIVYEEGGLVFLRRERTLPFMQMQIVETIKVMAAERRSVRFSRGFMIHRRLSPLTN